jgi:hypothetical protein
LALKSTNATDGNSLWSHINQGYWFIGQESLTDGLFVPFYNTNTGSGLQPINTASATNINFSTYTKTGGLVGNGATTYVDTGVNNNNNAAWPTRYRHGFVYATNTNNNYGGIFGTENVTGSGRTIGLIGPVNIPTSQTSNGYARNESGVTATIGFITPTSDGAWGIVNTAANSPVALGTNGANYITTVGVNPATTNLTNGIILIGRTAGLTSQANFQAFTMGSGFTTLSDFNLMGTIVATLISSLT